MFILFNLCLVLLLPNVVEAALDKVHLIWLCNPRDGYWERDWIPEILSELNCEIVEIVDINFEVFLDNTIFIVPGVNSTQYGQHCLKYHEMDLRFGVIHLGDETYRCLTDFYQHAAFVLRNYWHKKYLNAANVSFFPLGYTYEFWNNFTGQIQDSFHRKNSWAFVGFSYRSTRPFMLANMKRVPGSLIHDTALPNTPPLASAQYRDVLLDSIFIPCPMGQGNLDSFRVTEALECGCIPIVEKYPLDYFSKLFGSYPFPSVNTWEEAPDLVVAYLSDPEKLERLRMSCYTWWQNYKMDLKKRIAALVEEAFCPND